MRDSSSKIHFVFSENIRKPLPALLNGLIEHSDFYSLKPHFKILTQDSVSKKDLEQMLAQHPKLKNILILKNVLSVSEWINKTNESLENGLSCSPFWVDRFLFEEQVNREIQKDRSIQKIKKIEQILLSLYPVFKHCRRYQVSVGAFEDWISNTNTFLKPTFVRLYQEYQSLVVEDSFYVDQTSCLKRFLDALDKNWVQDLTEIKTIYWISPSFLSPETKLLAEKIEKCFPKIEQVGLFQKPQTTEEWEIWQSWPFFQKASVSIFEDQQTTFDFRKNRKKHRFAHPFEEASFIIDEIESLVKQGISPNKIALFLPERNLFWEQEFSAELKERGLYPSIHFSKPLSSFTGIRKTYTLPVKDGIAWIDQQWQRLRSEPVENPIEMRALFLWREALEQISARSLKANPNLLEWLSKELLIENEIEIHQGIQIRFQNQPGLFQFEKGFFFDFDLKKIFKGPTKFLGRSLPGITATVEIDRARILNSLNAANDLTITESVSKSPGKQEESENSTFLEEIFGFVDSENHPHPPLWFCTGSFLDDFSKRLFIERLRSKDRNSNHIYGGWIENQSLAQKWSEKIKTFALSPTQLESYQICPFRFFASQILKIREAKDETPEGSKLDQGRWLHEFLERLLSKEREGLIQAIQNCPKREEIFKNIPDHLDAFAEDFFSERPWMHKNFLPVFKKRTHDFTVRFLEKFWEEAEKQDPIFVPIEFEKEFEVQWDGLKIRGRIDRIDQSLDQRYRLIYDYKTGGLEELRKKIKDLRHLALPIYMLAEAEQADLSNQEIFGALFIDLKDLEDEVGVLRKRHDEISFHLSKRKQVWKDDTEWDAYFEGLKTRLKEMHQRILKADFRVFPTECLTYCEYKNICRYQGLKDHEL